MPKKSVVLLPETENILAQMGEQIKLARLRRRISAALVAERAGISRATLVAIEKGAPSVAIGCYAAVLHALNYMDRDSLLVAKDDEPGRKLRFTLFTKHLLSQRYIKNHHGHKSYCKKDSANVGVFSFGHLRNKLFNHNIHHCPGCKA